MRRSWFLRIVTVVALIPLGWNLHPTPALGAPCGLAATATLYGAGDVANLVGQGKTKCSSEGLREIGTKQQVQPYYTSEIVCSTDRQAAAEGICSTTPCSDRGRFFAF
jgi:hypothetical protein